MSVDAAELKVRFIVRADLDLRAGACSGRIHCGHRSKPARLSSTACEVGMNREFLDLYNRELKLLNEQAREFAEEYPGIAERLGGIARGSRRSDDRRPARRRGISRRSGPAQAQARISGIHEQSARATRAELSCADAVGDAGEGGADLWRPGASGGTTHSSRLLSGCTYRQLDRQLACRYRLCGDITLWPFELTGAEYFSSPAPLQALGVSVGSEVLAGLRLTLTHRSAVRAEDEPTDAEALKKPEMLFAGCRTNNLPMYFAGIGSRRRCALRAAVRALWGNLFPLSRRIRRSRCPSGAAAIAFSRSALIGKMRCSRMTTGYFEGFDLLREFFMFPRKFLGFNLDRPRRGPSKLKAKTVDIMFAFNEVNARLAAAVQPSMFALYAAPAINLFEKTTDRIALKSSQHEYHVVPDRSRYLEYEPHRILEVYAHYPGGREQGAGASALLGFARTAQQVDPGPLYTVRRLPRRRTIEEKSVWRDLGLYGNRHVHFSQRARRRRR